MNIQVTSASKKEQKLSQVPSAIFVITQEDIRRSGAMSIPDLLRMVPGLDVAQINANTWAISARGFNLQFANKLLVLVDGRAVYTPLFGGVYWETLDVPLEDIERIEVIRGPGGTVWGANAVNGVISIITKSAAETRGGLMTGGGGTLAQGFGTVQYGGKIKEDSNYRVFAKYLNNDHLPDLNGQNGEDSWHLFHGGVRVDTKLSPKDSLIVEGDVYDGREGSVYVHSILSPPQNLNVQGLAILSGGNVLGRWSHIFSSRRDVTLQLYFDNYDRDGPESDDLRNTFDLDFQNHIFLNARQDLIWGLGYRHIADQTAGTIDQAFLPAHFAGDLFNLFAQDQITLVSDRLDLYVGSKFENDYFTGFDFDPSVRLAWTPSNHRTFWAAVSRASRTPTRRDIGLDAALAALPGPSEVAVLGNPNMKSEHVLAYELGYRAQPTDSLSLDVAVFFNTYHGLESLEPAPSFFESDSGTSVLILPIGPGQPNVRDNAGSGGLCKLESNASLDAQPGLFVLEHESAYRCRQPRYRKCGEHGGLEPEPSGSAPVPRRTAPRLQLGCKCLLCRAFAGTTCSLLHTAGYAGELEACGTNRTEPGGTKSAPRPPRRVQQFLAERQFIAGQAQRLREDYVAVLTAR